MMMEEVTPQQHLTNLADFMRKDKALGGPDPHIATLGPLLEGLPIDERIWRCGCYAAVYNVPVAEAIWLEFSYDRIRWEPDALEPWLAANWRFISLRRERRGVRLPHKLARCLLSYVEWMGHRPQEAWSDSDEGYTVLWESIASSVWNMGRYIQIKLLEALGRHAGGAFTLQDLRPIGGASPRETLAWLYPSHADELTGGSNSPGVLGMVNLCSRWAMEELRERHGLDPSWFELQVGLCEYKTAYSRQRQYPGRTLDTELAYWFRVEPLGHEARFLEARKQIAPEVALGELQGWLGERKLLGTTLRRYGYLWSDLHFDYAQTYDYAQPVCR